MIDICIHDTIGMGFDMTKPLGGSEVGLFLLAEGFRKAGLSVSFDLQECRALIVSRYSDVPDVKALRTVIYAADIYDDRYEKHLHYPIQCVSEFQAGWFRSQGFHTRVIRPIMGGHVQAEKRIEDRWIYPCAAGKGLEATLRAWAESPRSHHPLIITTTGYDEPDAAMCADHHAVFIGQFSPQWLAYQISISHGMFYRNVREECFPMTVAIAQHCGLELDIQCVGHSMCGIEEAMRDQDLREETIIPQWLHFLGLR